MILNANLYQINSSKAEHMENNGKSKCQQNMIWQSFQFSILGTFTVKTNLICKLFYLYKLQ